MRVQIVDPPAYTPPYDRALCAALTAAGADVELVTTRFPYGPVPVAEDYCVTELFYPRASRRAADDRFRQALRLLEHVPGMRRLRAHSREADIIHLQWSSLPTLDRHLLPKRPRVFTMHDPLPDSGRRRRAWLELLKRMDAVIAHSAAGVAGLGDAGIDAARLHRVPHGAFEHLTDRDDERSLPPELAAVQAPVILFFGLVRPYKGVDVLLEAFRELDGAELWIVGMPRMDLAEYKRMAKACSGRVRFVSRFITDPEIASYFRRADVVALPYRQIEQSGVLYTALAFAKPVVASAVGGFSEVGATGAIRLVEPGNAEELAAALAQLAADPSAREQLGIAAQRAASGEYSWSAIAERTLDVYRGLLHG